jgi:hypothetical protein
MDLFYQFPDNSAYRFLARLDVKKFGPQLVDLSVDKANKALEVESKNYFKRQTALGNKPKQKQETSAYSGYQRRWQNSTNSTYGNNRYNPYPFNQNRGRGGGNRGHPNNPRGGSFSDQASRKKEDHPNDRGRRGGRNQTQNQK